MILRNKSENMSMKILVVDDERAVRESIERALTQEGYQVKLAENGQLALEKIGSWEPDVVVLDILMPGIDGLDVCRRLRAEGNNVPVLMLTARVEVSDRIDGLDAGADDYLTKPFDLEELLARLRALLRRSTLNGAASKQVFEYASLRLNQSTYEAYRDKRRLDLTRTEYQLLELLIINAEQVLTRDIIYDRVWGYDFGYQSNSIDVYIGYLRRKTEDDGEKRLIQTVRGIGYVLRES